ncbi:hypothetical protein LUZ60_008040 [Juncus effusus]|nr:hypothetical protein LUZ60_008040 [Juncus effusus]
MADCDCRPLAFLIGLPFAILSLILSLLGAVIWLIGSILSCICPCCACFSILANFAMELVQVPFKVMECFIDLIPC